MNDKDVKKLKRDELLELLIFQKKENEKLERQLDAAMAQLEDKQIRIEKSGSIAEASYMLNGLFDAAQETVLQYLQNTCRVKISMPRNFDVEENLEDLEELREKVLTMEFKKGKFGGYDQKDVEAQLESIVSSYEKCVLQERDAYNMKITEYEENIEILQMLVTELNHKIYNMRRDRAPKNRI